MYCPDDSRIDITSAARRARPSTSILYASNYIYYNVDGIEIYRNCGEHGETPRPSEAHSNEIRYNTIYNHHNLGFGTSSFKTRHADKSHGIHVGSRQALPFPNMQNWTCQGGVTDVFCNATQLGTWKGAPLPVGYTDTSLGWPKSSGGAVGRCNNSTYERIDWHPVAVGIRVDWLLILVQANEEPPTRPRNHPAKRSAAPAVPLFS